MIADIKHTSFITDQLLQTTLLPS